MKWGLWPLCSVHVSHKSQIRNMRFIIRYETVLLILNMYDIRQDNFFNGLNTKYTLFNTLTYFNIWYIETNFKTEI